MVPLQVPPHPSGHVAPVQVLEAQEQSGVQQGCSLQLWELDPEQSAPPLAGDGVSQVRVWVPPPQETEQAPQLDQPPSTGPPPQLSVVGIVVFEDAV